MHKSTQHRWNGCPFVLQNWKQLARYLRGNFLHPIPADTTTTKSMHMWCLHTHQASSASRAEQSSGDNKSPSLFPHGGSNFWHFVAPTWPCNCSKRLHRRINSSYILAITRCQLLRKQRIHIYEEGFNVTSNLEGRCIIIANLLSLLNRLISSAIYKVRDGISKTQIKDVVSTGGIM